MVAMPELSLEDALAELDALIGLERVKHEVRTLTNFLKLQQRRRDAGLPETEISLHMVFHGNPGTGKTTVARIVGKIFGAMGILAKGHLVETDRSGLVAEYAGQTGPKTNAKVDEALDGVLFIDEAYSLIAEGEDPFGREAVQALLKRIEDQRQRLVVVFAGYPEEMRTLLRSNPGLSSRFSRQLSFDDYLPLEMARIFGLMCGKNHYELTSAARLELLQGLSWWYDHRDRHFGNGRAVRNLFEHAIRRLANRLATIEELSADQLSLLEADDIEFSDVPAEVFASETDGAARVHVACPSCDHANDVPGGYLGRQLQCPKCKKGFTAEWGELVE
jgi:SpoVK/Ycf46/Vps4 family AAA+-type ATPase